MPSPRLCALAPRRASSLLPAGLVLAPGASLPTALRRSMTSLGGAGQFQSLWIATACRRFDRPEQAGGGFAPIRTRFGAAASHRAGKAQASLRAPKTAPSRRKR